MTPVRASAANASAAEVSASSPSPPASQRVRARVARRGDRRRGLEVIVEDVERCLDLSESARGGRGLRCRLRDERERADACRGRVCCPSGEIGDRRDWSLLKSGLAANRRCRIRSPPSLCWPVRLVAKGQMGQVGVQLLNTTCAFAQVPAVFRGEPACRSLNNLPETTSRLVEAPDSPVKRIHRAGDAFVHRPH